LPGSLLPGADGRKNALRHFRLTALLVRFQVFHDTYCPFCLAFGLCILVLFASNFMKMNKYLALGAFLAGIAAFAFLFEGSVVPLYR